MVSYFMKRDINNLYLEKHNERLIIASGGAPGFWVRLIITFDRFAQIFLISDPLL